MTPTIMITIRKEYEEEREMEKNRRRTRAKIVSEGQLYYCFAEFFNNLLSCLTVVQTRALGWLVGMGRLPPGGRVMEGIREGGAYYYQNWKWRRVNISVIPSIGSCLTMAPVISDTNIVIFINIYTVGITN